jgi:hypothetical protein
MSRRSFTYEERLYKYAQRGFEVGVPCLDLRNVDMDRLQGRLPEQCKGLTKLLVYHFLENERHPYYDSNWAFHDSPFKIARRHSITCQKLMEVHTVPDKQQPEKKQKRWRSSDYGYLPRWGLFTPDAIQDLYDNQKTTFTMRDSTTILLCPLENLYSIARNGDIKWITENPGRQMMTGSFHPIEDSAWEDKENWALGYLPKQLLRVEDIFETKYAIMLQKLREKVRGDKRWICTRICKTFCCLKKVSNLMMFSLLAFFVK